MKQEDFKKAQLLMDELVPIHDMLTNIKKCTPTLTVNWGSDTLLLKGFSSPDSNRNLVKAVILELQARENNILKQLENI